MEFSNDLHVDIAADLRNRIARIVIVQTMAPTAVLFAMPSAMRELAQTLIESADKIDESADLEQLWETS